MLLALTQVRPLLSPDEIRKQTKAWMQLRFTYLLLTPGMWVCKAAYCADKESEAPRIPDPRTQAECTKVQASLGLPPATGILFLVSVSLLLSLEVLQGDLLYGVSLTLLFISSLLPLMCRGALNTLRGRKKSHNRSIASRPGVAVGWRSGSPL